VILSRLVIACGSYAVIPVGPIDFLPGDVAVFVKLPAALQLCLGVAQHGLSLFELQLCDLAFFAARSIYQALQFRVPLIELRFSRCQSRPIFGVLDGGDGLAALNAITFFHEHGLDFAVELPANLDFLTHRLQKARGRNQSLWRVFIVRDALRLGQVILAATEQANGQSYKARYKQCPSIHEFPPAGISFCLHFLSFRGHSKVTMSLTIWGLFSQTA